MIQLYSICVKFSGERQGGKICDRKDGLQDLITFGKQNPSVSCISGVCLKSEPFTLQLASSVVRLTSLKCMDSSLGQFQWRSRLTPTGYQATIHIHSASASTAPMAQCAGNQPTPYKPALEPQGEQFPKPQGWEDPQEKEMATHSSIVAWETAWTEEPGGPQSMGSQGVGHD